jgi:hypothetical protein
LCFSSWIFREWVGNPHMNQFFATRWNLTLKPANKSLIIPRLDMQNICAIFWGNLAVFESDLIIFTPLASRPAQLLERMTL